MSKTACKAFERGISVFFSTSGHLDVRTLVFLSQMYWGLISSVLISRDRGLNLLLLQEQCFLGKISSYCVLTHWAGEKRGVSESIALSLLPIWMWSFFYLLLRSRCLANPHVHFRRNQSICNIYLLCPWEKVSSYTVILNLPLKQVS